MSNEMLDSYKAYVQSQCSFWSPGNDDCLSGEIIFQWFNRKSLQREMSGQQAELSRIDGILSGLMYEQKKRLSRLGRNGAWCGWLRQHGIPRSTADRLTMEHAEFFGLQNELPHREQVEPLEGRISQAAYRVSGRHDQMLPSPRSRMLFVRCLADLLGLVVDIAEDGSARLSTPVPVSDEDIDYRVPNVMQIAADGSAVPINYELANECGEDDSKLKSQEISSPVEPLPAIQTSANSASEEPSR
jgi:hypothetical protein